MTNTDAYPSLRSCLPSPDRRGVAEPGVEVKLRLLDALDWQRQRAHAFSNDGLSPPLHALIGKVATRPALVTEADFTAANASGFGEDQLLGLVICAAVGQTAQRLLDQGPFRLGEHCLNLRA